MLTLCVINFKSFKNNRVLYQHFLLNSYLGELCQCKHLKSYFSFQMYLNKYHYLSISRSGDQNVKQAIETFQDLFHLNVTGMLNDETIAAMKNPRCGNPDVDQQTGRYKRYSIPGWNRWHFKDISYYLQPGSNMDEVTQRRIIKQAFDMWARYTGFTFEPADIPENADIKIR